MTGFPRATIEQKIQGIKYYLLHYPVNSRQSTLLLTALGGYPEIAKFLFESGAKIFNDKDQLYTKDYKSNATSIVFVCGTAFNENVTTTPECILLLLEHVITADYLYPERFIRLINTPVCGNMRLSLLTSIPAIPDNLVKGLAAFIHKCYLDFPSNVVCESLIPKDPVLREILMLQYGISYDIPISQAVYAAFQKSQANHQANVDMAKTCQVLFDEVKAMIPSQ